MPVIRFLAWCIGFGMTLTYCYLWVMIALKGGRMEVGFNAWYEWWVEPFLLVAMVVVIVLAVVGGLVHGKR